MINNDGPTLLKDIRRQLHSHFEFKVLYNFQKGNCSADWFANLEIDKCLDTNFFSLPQLHRTNGDLLSRQHPH